MSRWTRPFLALTLAGLPAVASAETSPYATRIAEMKAAERGPFSQIRWFCADGSVHPPLAAVVPSPGLGSEGDEDLVQLVNAWLEQVRASGD